MAQQQKIYGQEKYLLYNNLLHEQCVSSWRKLSWLGDRWHPVKSVPTEKQSHREWTYNAEASGKQLANPPSDWSPHHDVIVVKLYPRDQLEAPKQIMYAFKIK